MINKYYSQCGQDEYLNRKIFRNRKNGSFLDIGANDGKSFSNTYFFEKELNWTGICIEPLPEVFKELQKNRTSININGCIADFEGEGIFYQVSGYAEMLSGLKSKYDQRHLDRIYREINQYGGELKETTVMCYNINKLLEQHSFKVIDFLSLDIEGGELDVLKTIDFDKFSFNAIAVENNHGENHINDFLKTKGFKKITNLSGDDIYIRKIGFLTSFKSLFRTNKN